MDIHEIVKKLIGPVNPVGETNIDNDRFENLKVLTDLADKLLSDIDDVAAKYKNNDQFSMIRASEFADKFQKDLAQAILEE